MPKDQDSQSIFNTATKHDVRHDIDTVHQKWDQETLRRRKRAAILSIPVVLILVLIYLLLAYNIYSLPGYFLFHERPQPHDHQAEMANQARIMGNTQCKIKMAICDEIANAELVDLLKSAVDSKPSEFHLQLLKTDELNEQQKQAMKETPSYCAFTINGQPTLSYTLNGESHTLDLSTGGRSFIKEELVLAIVMLHEKLYGPAKTPIFDLKDAKGAPLDLKAVTAQKLKEQQEFDEERAREEKKRNSFMSELPAVQQAPRRK